MIFISRSGLSTGLLALSLILAACSTTPRQATYDATMPDTSRMTIDGMVLKADKSAYPLKGQLLLQAVGVLLNKNDTDRARSILDQIEPNRLDNSNRNQYSLLEADYAVTTHNTRSAQEWLSTISAYNLKNTQRIQYHQIKARLHELDGNYSQNIEQLGLLLPYLPKDDRPRLYQTLWNNLLFLNENQLLDLLTTTPGTLKPWIELAIIYRTPGELEHQLTELNAWEQRWPGSDTFIHLPQSIIDLQNAKPYQPDKIALLLPMSGSLAQAGEAVREGFMAGYYESAKKKLHVPEIQFYDSATSNPAELALQAESEGAGLVIGPLSRNTVESAIANSRITIPQLTLNYANDATPTNLPVYQIGLAAEDEAQQAAARAWKDGFRSPAILIPDSDWGQRVAAAFTQEWQSLGGKLLSTVHYTEKGDFNQAASKLLLVNESQQRASNLQRILGKKLDFTPRRRQDVDMIFMVATAANGRQLKPALDFYFAYDLPVYSTSGIYSGQQDPARDRDLSGIRFPVMPWHLTWNSSLKETITREWPSSTGQYGSLFALGADVWRLYPRMEQMSRSPGAQMFGATGTLSINEQGNVERQLIWQYFDNGRPNPLSHEYSARKTHAIHILDSNNQEPAG